MHDPSRKKKGIEDYYREEHQYLDEAGREFADAHPQRARFLKLSQRDDRDPYVERLFEGFAFLTGRVRQKLDDELPELTQSLLGLMWPHFLRPVPSLSILEFQTTPGRIQEPQIVERGAEVASQPVGRERRVCRFRTCYDVHIRPIRLSQAALEGNSVLRFQFRVDNSVDPARLFSMEGEDEYQKRCRKAIRLFIHDVDQSTASMLHLYLTRYVQKTVIQVTPKEAAADASVTLQGQEGVQAVGFSPEEGLLPYTEHSFSGYRLLQEYFAYPRKFFFIDLLGLDQFTAHTQLEEMEGFEVQVHFQRPFPTDRRFAASNFRLNCTPIVNLLQTEAQPKTIDYESTEYRINAPEGCEVYSLDTVVGIVGSTMERRTYIPFYSFKHSLASREAESDRYYHTRTQLVTGRDPEGQPETRQNTYITIVGPDEEADSLKEETLSIGLTCTNGRWGREPKAGDIRNRTSSSSVPEFVQFRNLTQPTIMLYPPLQAGLEWRFISHLALNYLSLSDPEALRGILELYNWSVERSDREANRRRISSIARIDARPRDIPHRGTVIRGIEVTLEVIRGNFADDGDIYLFGLVMNEFLSLYASINSFVQLTIVSYETKEELFRWTPEVMSSQSATRQSLMRRRHLPL
jgi:type VI secretion system protein ImpG